MKIKTYYKIYYKHRVEKANFLLKLYLYFVVPFKYLINIPYLKKTINLDTFSEVNKSLFDRDLNYLFEFFNSDKGESFINQYDQPSKRDPSVRVEGHNYAKFYEELFKQIKQKKINILEIGSFYGNASASLFFYFRNSFLYAADIFPDLFRYESKRISNFFVDSSDEISIKKNIINIPTKFDVIIEDASHSLKDQIISLFLLFKKINSEGLFIIEELDFPETRKDMNLKNEKPSLKEIFQKIKKNKYFDSKYILPEDKKYFLNNFSNIEIYKGNFNEIAIIKKK